MFTFIFIKSLKNCSPHNSNLRLQIKARNIMCAHVLSIRIFNFPNKFVSSTLTYLDL